VVVLYKMRKRLEEREVIMMYCCEKRLQLLREARLSVFGPKNDLMDSLFIQCEAFAFAAAAPVSLTPLAS
jgi:hypothetical protein